MTVITCIEDLRVLAQRRVPRMFYDYADSGSWTEGTYRSNESDFAGIKLRQRVAVNMEHRTLKTTMAGQEVSMPLALAPVGLVGMQHADGEILAERFIEVHADLAVGQQGDGAFIELGHKFRAERGEAPAANSQRQA